MAEYQGTPEEFADHKAAWGDVCDCTLADAGRYTAPPQEPARIPRDVLADALSQLNHDRRVVLCHPDQLAQVQEAVAALPPELTPGMIEVRSNRFAKSGELICFRQEDSVASASPLAAISDQADKFHGQWMAGEWSGAATPNPLTGRFPCGRTRCSPCQAESGRARPGLPPWSQVMADWGPVGPRPRWVQGLGTLT